MGQKILVVEDNELNLKLFCDLLRAHGYAADPVRDGREALERARAFEPDLVVMDIQMPHVSGLELIEQMKADEGLRRTPIMAVTAYAAKGDEERIRDAGAEGYVSKPISVVRFVEAVRGLLEAAATRIGAAEESSAVPTAAEEGDTAAAAAIEAAQRSVEIEKEVAAEGDEAAARAVDAASGAGGERAAADAVEASAGTDEVIAEPAVEDGEGETGTMRHAAEGRHPESEVDEELDPGLRRDDAGPKGETP